MEILFDYVLPAVLFLIFVALAVYIITRAYFIKLLIQHMLNKRGYVKDGDCWVNEKENRTFYDSDIDTIINCLKGEL